MSALLENKPAGVESAMLPENLGFDGESPFGLQGLARNTLRILKPGFVQRLAVTLATRGTPAQILDPQFVAEILARNESWMEEYRVVHLIEKSLWIDGRSDLVMTLTRNPSQIPDNPPKEITEALSLANHLHPQATVWYGVPLFSDRTNAEGLPIPMTADEVQMEARRRISAAQQRAINWGWLIRAVCGLCAVPSLAYAAGASLVTRVASMIQRVKDYYAQAKLDRERRRRAMMCATMEKWRFGYSKTLIPKHTTMLGVVMEQGIEGLHEFEDQLEGEMTETLIRRGAVLTDVGVKTSVVLPLPILIPIMVKFATFTPTVIVSCDPFLFVELPGEPDKLRHLGHWYWQKMGFRKQKLHLHEA